MAKKPVDTVPPAVAPVIDPVAAPVEPESTEAAAPAPGEVGSVVNYYLKDGDFNTPSGAKIDGSERQALVTGIPHPELRDLLVRLLEGDHTAEHLLERGLVVTNVVVRDNKAPGSCKF